MLAPGSGATPWRDMLNLRPHEGELRFREPVLDGLGFSTPSYTINDATNSAVPLWVGEIPVLPTVGNARYLFITTMDWWITHGATWYNITPQHSTGTVAV